MRPLVSSFTVDSEYEFGCKGKRAEQMPKTNS
jgi:hypothetical protein